MTEKITLTETVKILEGYDKILLELVKEWHDAGYSFPGHFQEKCSKCGTSLDTPLILEREASLMLSDLRRGLRKAINAYSLEAQRRRP